MKRIFLAVGLTAALVSTVRADEDPNAYEVTSTWIASADGTPLRTHVFRPKNLGPDERTPVILEVTPYAGSGGAFFFDFDPANQEPSGPPLGDASRMFERGYSAVVVSLRGYGGSGGCYDFGGSGEQADVVAAVDQFMRFFDRHLKGLVVPDDPAVMVQEVDGRWRAETEWPPADAAHHPLPLGPGSYLDLPGNHGETGLPAQFPFQPPVPLPTGRGSWTFTPPLPYELHAAGLSRLTATVSILAPGVNLVALVYDVAADGNARFVTRGAYLLPGSGRFTFDLYPQDWRFPPGHRIGVLLTSSDDAWFEPSGALLPVTIESAELSVPFLTRCRTAFLETGPFHPRKPHPPFAIDEAAIEAGTVPVGWPPEPEDS